MWRSSRLAAAASPLLDRLHDLGIPVTMSARSEQGLARRELH